MDGFVYTFRYFWRVKGSDDVMFKIHTDTLQGHNSLIDSIKFQVKDLISFGREYVSQIDVSKMSSIENLLEVKDETL